MARVINSNLSPVDPLPPSAAPPADDKAALPATERRRREALRERFASEPASPAPTPAGDARPHESPCVPTLGDGNAASGATAAPPSSSAVSPGLAPLVDPGLVPALGAVTVPMSTLPPAAGAPR